MLLLLSRIKSAVYAQRRELRGLVGDIIKKVIAEFGRRDQGGLLASLIFR